MGSSVSKEWLRWWAKHIGKVAEIEELEMKFVQFFFFSLISLALARIHQFRDCLGRWKQTEKLIEKDLKLDLDWMSVAGSREKSENYLRNEIIFFSRISISGHCLLALSSEKWCEIKFSFSHKHSLQKCAEHQKSALKSRARKAPHEANKWHAHVSLL